MCRLCYSIFPPIAFGSGSGSTTACTGIPIEVNLVAQLTEQTEGNTLCEFNDRQNCLFKFSYSFVLSGSNELIPIVHVKQTKDCPTSINLPLIISSVIGSVFIAGMTMIMLWKLATTIHDKREYSKFVKERAKGTWAIVCFYTIPILYNCIFFDIIFHRKRTLYTRKQQQLSRILRSGWRSDASGVFMNAIFHLSNWIQQKYPYCVSKKICFLSYAHTASAIAGCIHVYEADA